MLKRFVTERTFIIVTGRTVVIAPISPVAAWCCLVVAADAVVLPVAGLAPFPVPGCHETMAQRTPGVRMVPRRRGVVAFDAVVLRMAGCTVTAGPATQVRRGPVVLNPACLMGPGLREWYALCARSLAGARRSGRADGQPDQYENQDASDEYGEEQNP